MSYKIENYIQALNLLNAYSEMRQLYENMVLIADEEHVSEELNFEARELTNDGFDVFIGKLQKRSGNNADK